MTLAESAGWGIDRVEVDALLPEALLSWCQVPAGHRDAMATWLAERIEQTGGPVRAAYERSGRDPDAIEDLLELSRIQSLADRAALAASADCPFTLRPRGDFTSRQVLDNQWFLSALGGGKGITVLANEELDVSFGGAGRLLVGWAPGTRWAVMTGLEIGGSGSFPRAKDGSRGSLVFGFDAIAPLAVRYRLVNAYV